MNRLYGKRKKCVFTIGIILSLSIATAILLMLFLPHGLTTIIPDLNSIENDRITSFEIIVRDPENPDYSRYSYVTNKTRINEYIDFLNKIRVQRVLSMETDKNEQYEIIINMYDGSKKTIRINGDYISGTQYKIINTWYIYLFSGSDTDIEFDGQGVHSYIDENFSSNIEGITLLSDLNSFNQYLDSLIDINIDSQRLREYYQNIYTNEYFEFKSIIMVNYKIAPGETSIGIDSLIINGDTLNILINLETTNDAAFYDKQYKLFLLNVTTSDIMSFSDYQIIVRDFS